MSQVLWKWALEDAASDDQAPGHGLEGDHLKQGGPPSSQHLFQSPLSRGRPVPAIPVPGTVGRRKPVVRVHLRVEGDGWHTTGGMAPEASGWPRRPLLLTHRGEGGAQGNGLERPGSPKCPLLFTPRGVEVSNNGRNGLGPPGSPIGSLCGTPIGGRIPHNGENGPGAARIANPSLCGSPIGGRMPHNGGNGVGRGALKR